MLPFQFAGDFEMSENMWFLLFFRQSFASYHGKQLIQVTDFQRAKEKKYEVVLTMIANP